MPAVHLRLKGIENYSDYAVEIKTEADSIDITELTECSHTKLFGFVMIYSLQFVSVVSRIFGVHLHLIHILYINIHSFFPLHYMFVYNMQVIARS